MKTIKNIKPLNAEELFDLLKKEFAEFVNSKLDSNLTIEYAHVYDMINVLFPEIIEGNAFTITVTDDEISVVKNEEDMEYDVESISINLDIIQLIIYYSPMGYILNTIFPVSQ